VRVDAPEHVAVCWGILLSMTFTVELEREDDGRWIAEVVSLPGVMAYGATREQALAAVKALTLRVLADKIEHGEIGSDLSSLSFLAA
jgi:predicted RNase H-like HicB family nuclease